MFGETDRDPLLNVVLLASLLGLGLLCLLANFGIVDFAWLNPRLFSLIPRPFL